MKYFYQLIICVVFVNTIYSQCINSTPFGTATISSCSSGTITALQYAGEYSQLTFNTTGTYTFASSNSTDWLTFTDASNNVVVFGQQPLVVNVSNTGGYRLHVSTNSACGTQSTNRTTTYACGAVSTTTGCIQATAYGSATITAYGSSQITSCNWAGEYSQLDIGITGLYTFESSNSSDFLTLTDASNTILYSGVTPLSANIISLGNYRLHVSTSSFCGTNNTCRVTSYTCTPNTPCSGNPNAGSTNATSTVVCGAQNIDLNLVGSTVATGLTYQWQSSPNNIAWTNLSGQTNATTNQFVSSNTYYRCIVACGSNTASSVSQLITVGGNPTGGSTYASASSICSGSNINFYLFGNSSWTGLTYQWQTSTNNATWSNLSGYISPTISYLPTSAIYVRCLLSCGSSTVTSAPVYISAPSAISYATLPLYETFDNTWQSGCATRNVPTTINWSSSPATGDRAWRRQNDGSSASWNNASFNVAAPHSGTGCANFHSTEVDDNNKGDLDVYVDMTQVGKYAISFYYINPSGSDNLTVQYSENAGLSYSNKGYYTTQPTWTKKTIYYSNTNASPNSIVRFRGEGSSTTTDDLAIDSLSIRLICTNPNITAMATNTAICAGETTTLIATGATNYTWMPSSQTGSMVIVSPTANTNFVLTGTNDNLCFPTSVVNVSVTVCPVGIEEFNDAYNINVYPNPVHEILNFKLEMISEQVSNIDGQILITNLLGKTIFQTTSIKQQNTINVSEFTSGVYFYQLKQHNKIIKQGKFIKE